MSTHTPLFAFLEYSVGAVEAAIARGETPRFEAATPTFYDAFFTLADQLGVLTGIEALADPRQEPYVPLPLLVILTICRFLHGHRSFRRMGEILLKDQALLERFKTLVGENGGTVDGVDKWERRRLAYEVKGKREGIYVVMNFSGEPATEAELGRVLGITEGVLRHLVIRTDAK